MMWTLLLITSVLIGRSLCCIPCDRRGKDLMDDYHTILNSQVDNNAEAFATMKSVSKGYEREVLDYLENEVQQLDEYTISEIVSEYKLAVEVIEKINVKDANLLYTIGRVFNKLKEKVKNIVQDGKPRRCPNKQGPKSCGLMVQEFINCKTCAKENVICAGGPPQNQEYFDRCSCLCNKQRCFDLITGKQCTACKDHREHLSETLKCGEQTIKVIEYEDVSLDCALDWHGRLEDSSYRNTFTKRPYFKAKVTEEAYLHLKAVHPDDAGTYTCTTTVKFDLPVSRIVYHVTVESPSLGEEIKFTPRPTLPDRLDLDGPEPPSTMAIVAITMGVGAAIVMVAGIGDLKPNNILLDDFGHI
ncbi:uncharacterized protein [Engystomops pustulosus]|uniref:uncharacterized protein n=1 Tax=Engystomops pustulosus TaxID=76066 RepID=UPI003AFAD684